MILWRYTYDGRVCSGDNLTQLERNEYIKAGGNPAHYLLVKGKIIDFAVKTIFYSVIFIIVGITCVALCYK